MSCPNYKQLCKKLVISESVTFTDGNFIVNIPQANYQNNEKYCIVIAQTIPTETTITAPVVITIGDGTTQYPMVYCDCTPVVACSINTRTRYSVFVRTGVNDGVFALMKKLPCSQCVTLPNSLPVATTTTTTTTDAGGGT